MINKASLQQACYDIARITSWENHNAQSTSLDAITAKANQYVEVALEYAKELDERGADPDVAIGAVRYLSVHAVPMMGDDVHWLGNMLEVIVDLFAPIYSVERGSDCIQFLKSLRDAIDRIIPDDSADE
jgi:hypothetical protein